MPVDLDALEIIRCPVTGQALTPVDADGTAVATPDRRYIYPVIDGIFVLILTQLQTLPTDPKEIVRAFYENFGWNISESGKLNDTAMFVDSSTVPRRYTERCNQRINRYLSDGGRFLLDAGSGPITHPEYLNYHERFDRRVCVDFSLPALKQARQKIGKRGIYIVGDITNLPLARDSVQAAVCCHVVYHVPAEQQEHAFGEIARVVSPGGRAVVVYRWQDSPLSWRLEKIMKAISKTNSAVTTKGFEQDVQAAAPPLYFHPHTVEWFEKRAWPFRYRLASYRLIDNYLMSLYIRETWLWKAFTLLLFGWQCAMPRFTGKYGLYPLIIIEK